MNATLEEYKEIVEKPKRKCWNCKGTGKIKFKMQNASVLCLLCDGSGSITNEKYYNKNVIRGNAKTGLTGRRGRRGKPT